MKEINLTTKISVYLLEECTETEKKLIEAAKQATKNAYARYSNFKVGAALLLENGEVITGNNQENAAYPSGTCAERTAVFFANANYPDQTIIAIAVAAHHNGGFTKDVVTPCGACRQVLWEFCDENFRITVATDGVGPREYRLGDLLPEAFQL